MPKSKGSEKFNAEQQKFLAGKPVVRGRKTYTRYPARYPPDQGYTGELRDARIIPCLDDKYKVKGRVWNDAKNRFPDGEEITTSMVLNIVIDFQTQTATINTRNSKYWVDGTAIK